MKGCHFSEPAKLNDGLRSGFKVRTICPAAERPVRSLNIDRENGRLLQLHLMVSHLTSLHFCTKDIILVPGGNAMIIASIADWLNGRASASYS